jgi:chromosomal replication initiator protein
VTIHTPELVKQHSKAKEVNSRLFGRHIKDHPLVEINDDDHDRSVIRALEQQITNLKAKLAGAEVEIDRMRHFGKEAATAKSKVIKLELDLADARARILSQAQLLKATTEDAEGGEVSDNRRSVREIVAEVLQDFPDVTWEDVISVRRVRTLIAPRHACMRAVYDERKDLSLPRLGRLFHRDHTVILYALKKGGMQAVQHDNPL